MTLGLRAGMRSSDSLRFEQARALAEIPMPKLVAVAADLCGDGAAQRMTREQLINMIGVENALDLCDCTCGTGGSLGSLLGAPGDSFVMDPFTPLNPDLIPKIPDVTPGGPADVPSSPKMSGDGFPASPPFRVGNWSNDGNGNLLPQYFIAPGDTWSGLARLYLGGPTRWKELWAPNKGQFPNPDVLAANVTVVMPEEARAAAQAMVDKKLAPVSPPSPGSPGSVPGAPQVGPSTAASSTPKWVVPAAIGAAIVTIGGVAYAVTR